MDSAEVSFFSKLQTMLTSTTVPLPVQIRNICGVDASYQADNVQAVATSFIDGRLVESHSYRGKFTFPYVSGLFYLHEGPFVVSAVQGLKNRPDLVCFDAHGVAHPRSFGLATVCGMVLGIPSIGIAKSKLVGETNPYKKNLDKVLFDGKEVGFVTRHEAERYWSPGFSVSLEELENIIAKCSEVCVRSIEEADRLSRFNHGAKK